MKYLLDGQESDRLKFRKVRDSDYSEWLKFFQDPITKRYWEGEISPAEIECKEWYEKQFYRYQNDLGGMNALIEKDSNVLIGHCGVQILSIDGNEEFEIGYSVLPKFWGKGYASEASQRVRDFAFENNFNDYLVSVISHSNVPSQVVAKKNGMKIFKNSTYKSNDVYVYKITKQEWKTLISNRDL